MPLYISCNLQELFSTILPWAKSFFLTLYNVGQIVGESIYGDNLDCYTQLLQPQQWLFAVRVLFINPLSLFFPKGFPPLNHKFRQHQCSPECSKMWHNIWLLQFASLEIVLIMNWLVSPKTPQSHTTLFHMHTFALGTVYNIGGFFQVTDFLHIKILVFQGLLNGAPPPVIWGFYFKSSRCL